MNNNNEIDQNCASIEYYYMFDVYINPKWQTNLGLCVLDNYLQSDEMVWCVCATTTHYLIAGMNRFMLILTCWRMSCTQNCCERSYLQAPVFTTNSKICFTIVHKLYTSIKRVINLLKGKCSRISLIGYLTY